MFWGEVIVRKMTDSLETVGEGDLGVSEQVKELLGWEHFVREGDLVRDELELGVRFAFIILE